MSNTSEIRVLTAEERAEIKRLALVSKQDEPGIWYGSDDEPANVFRGDMPYIAAVSPDLTLGTLAYVEHLEARIANYQRREKRGGETWLVTKQFITEQGEKLAAAEARISSLQVELAEQKKAALGWAQDLAAMRDKLEMGWNLNRYAFAAGLEGEVDGLIKCLDEGAKVMYMPGFRDIRPDFAPPIAPEVGVPALSPSSQDPAGAEQGGWVTPSPEVEKLVQEGMQRVVDKVGDVLTARRDVLIAETPYRDTCYENLLIAQIAEDLAGAFGPGKAEHLAAPTTTGEGKEGQNG